MSVRDTSRTAFDGLDLGRRQRQVWDQIVEAYTGKDFTRKELAAALGWEINRVTGRVLELIDAKLIEEIPGQRRNGAHVLRIRSRQLELEIAA